MAKIISWFSCGITSAIACRLALEKYGKEKVVLIYIDTGTYSGENENAIHEDNQRFIKQCEAWLGAPIIRYKSSKYKNHLDVIEKTRYVNGPAGAACTKRLKRDIREIIEKDYIGFEGQIFGYDFKNSEINRSIRFTEQNPNSLGLYPLIEAKLTKNQCADLLLKNGITLPKMYKLGYGNNNCIGCPKGGMGYWNKIRIDFPASFDKMSKLEREIGHSCIKGVFLDSLDPQRGRNEKQVSPECDSFCELEFTDIIDKKVAQYGAKY